MKVKGDLEVVGAASASNLSGTNTGDQDLSGYALSTDLTNVAYTNVNNNFSVVQTFNGNVGVGTTPHDILEVSNGTGSIRFGGGNGRTLSAYNAGSLANFDFRAVQTYFDSDFLIAPNKKISTSNGNTNDLYLTTNDASKGVYIDRYIKAISFIKSGGLSTEFLKADGSIDDTQYPSLTEMNTKLDGKVDNSKVLTNVPAGAVFTDTVYNDSAIQAEVDLNTAKISFDSTTSSRLANTSGTNTGDNAVNSLYSGLVSNATHTGDVTGSTVLSIANGVININHLGNELAGVATLGTGNNIIDFKANIHYDKTLNAAWSPTFSNPVKGKSIVIIATGNNASYTLTMPSYVKGDISGWNGTKTNQLTLYCFDSVTPGYSIDIKTW